MKQYKILYSSEAEQDISDIHDYIANKLSKPVSATRIIRRIIEKCEKLETFPNGYAIRFHSNGLAIRFTHYGNYTVAFYVDDETETVFIYAVKYSRMNLRTTLTAIKE